MVFVDSRGRVWKGGKVVGVKTDSGIKKVSGIREADKYIAQQRRKKREERKRRKWSKNTGSTVKPAGSSTAKKPGKKIKVLIGRTSSGAPIEREVDVNELVELYRKGGREAVRKRFGEKVARDVEIEEKGGSISIRYTRLREGSAAAQRKSQARTAGAQEKVPTALRRFDEAAARAYAESVRNYKPQVQREPSMVLTVHRHEGVLGRLQHARERAFAAWMAALGGSRYYAEKSIEMAKAVPLPFAEGFAAAKAFTLAERGAAVAGVRAAAVFERAAGAVKSGRAASVLLGAGKVARKAPYAVKGAAVGTGGASFVVAAQESQKALKEGDVHRASMILTQTVAAGAGAARALPAPAPQPRREEFLVTYLTGVRRKQTELAWHAGGRVEVLRAEERTPHMVTERISWKEEPGEVVTLEKRGTKVRLSAKDGRITEIGGEVVRGVVQTKPAEAARQVKRVERVRGTPAETGTVALPGEVLGVREVLELRVPGPEGRRLPGEAAVRELQRGMRSRGRSTMKFEPPQQKPGRSLPARFTGGGIRRTAKPSAVEADPAKIAAAAMRRSRVRLELYEEPLVVSVRRLSREAPRRGLLERIAGVSRVLRTVVPAVTPKPAAAQKQRSSLLEGVLRDVLPLSDTRTRATQRTSPAQVVTLQTPVQTEIPAPPVLSPPTRPPWKPPAGPPWKPPAGPPRRPPKKPRRERAAKRERSPLALLLGKRHAKEFLMPFAGLRIGGSRRKKKRR